MKNQKQPPLPMAPRLQQHPKILALDPGTKTGWAYRDECGNVQTGMTLFLNSRAPGDRWLRMFSWLESWGLVDLLIFEAPFIHPKHRSGWGVAFGFTTLIELYGATKAQRTIAIAPTVLKQWVTGHGNANKEEMALFARNLGWPMRDDNEIDARWLLEYALKSQSLVEVTQHARNQAARLAGRLAANAHQGSRRAPRLEENSSPVD